MIYIKAKFVCENCQHSIESEIACNTFRIASIQNLILSPVAAPSSFKLGGDKILCNNCDDKIHKEEKVN